MSASAAAGFEARFRAHWAELATTREVERLVVGVSGGLDSMTLLFLLKRLSRPRAARGLPLRLTVVHVDHRMREGSDADARWVAKACADWDVPCHVRATPTPLRSEAEGRELRYRLFEDARRELGPGAWVATAHTASDQAETVLFRAARGAGPRGLAGILPVRAPFVVRPLLPFARRELAAFARRRGVPFREDPSNRDLRWTRNRIRRQLLPTLEEAVPGATAALATLADTCRLQAEALDRLLDDRIEAVSAAASPARPPPPGGLALDIEPLRAMPDPLLALLLRRALARVGGRPGRAGTRELLRFVRKARSGRRKTVPGGASALVSLGQLRLSPAPVAPASASTQPMPDVRIADRRPGQGGYQRGAHRVEVAWGPSSPTGFPFVACLSLPEVEFPLVVRPWRPGDRASLPYGKKKVKKLLLEARIPTDRRDGVPVLAGATGAVLWVPGLTRTAPPGPGTSDAPSARSGGSLWVGVRMADRPDPPASPCP